MDDPIVVVEGEKKVDALVEMGFSATTNPFGAEKWEDSFCEELLCRDLILWPDKDNPGHRHMRKVADSLHDIAGSIRVVEPPDSLSEKEDVWDGIKTLGWSREDVQAMLDQAVNYDPKTTLRI